MFGSKTTELLQYVDRCAYQKKSVALFKSLLDDRYSDSEVVSHTGHRMPAVSITQGADILKYLKDSDEVYDVIAVDEAFMIDGISDILIWLYKRGFSILVSSLTLSFESEPFEEMQKILPWATEIQICSAVCTVCGLDAYYTHKKVDDGMTISVGGDDLYEPRCWDHHIHVNQKNLSEV